MSPSQDSVGDPFTGWMGVEYLRPLQHGRLTAEGRLANRSRRIAYAEGEVVNDEGKVLAKASGTFFITDTDTLEQSERARL